MRVGIGCDHSALDMKEEIIGYLKEKGYEITVKPDDTMERNEIRIGPAVR